MKLKEYIQKREFEKTPEPEGKINEENAGRFVIQRHQARRLHYDLRLEMDGVLKSWAVPKGPSMNPEDKRLAVQTEDHPVKYLTFHGTIPKGNYGAGEMDIWDEGNFRVSPEAVEKDLLKQLEQGNLKIEFTGSRIKGNFALVHTNFGKEKNNWLLIKKKDAFATDLAYDAELITPFEVIKREKISVKNIKSTDLIQPMLASSAKKIFNDPSWVYELKWDGYRALANCESGKVRLYSRNGISFNSKFPSIADALAGIPHEVILDGEIVITDKKGVSVFQKLQVYDPKTSSDTLQYYVFDMLFLNGHNMMDLPLLERKSLIPEVINNISGLVYCDHIESMGTSFYKRALELGMEGVIAKKADSPYYPGTRSENWLKVKQVNTLEAIICGYTESVTGGSIFGSLILGMFKEKLLIYIGNCGSGINDQEQNILLKKLQKSEILKTPFSKKINLKGRKPHWVEPLLICEVKFSEWTKEGRLRHPVYKGLRTDKITTEITTEQRKTEMPLIKKKPQNNILDVDGISVPLTNLGKVLWPKSGLTKYDLIEYYIGISEYILPYLNDRPQNLHRHPNGIDKKGFYQKDNQYLPDWIATRKINSKSAEKDIEYLLCQNEATLLYMANLGCIEINPWNSRISNLDKPDYTVIDLDPSDTNNFEEVIEVALATKEVLDRAKVKGFCKTSGSSGLHIYLPLGAHYTYDEASAFTKLLCYFIHEKLPQLTSMERAVKSRQGKVYLDFMQNKRGQTLAAPYCLRPKEDAPASAPLEWKEVKSGLKIIDFNIHSLPERIKKIGDIFKSVLSEAIDMENAIDNLNAH
jgi:bifunctional non-homologous end joining protein LigD